MKTGIEFVEEYRKHSEKYYPMRDHREQVPERDEYGDVNIGWNAGLIDEKRPFFAECWSEDGTTMLTVFISTMGLEETPPEKFEQMLIDCGYFRYTKKRHQKAEIMPFEDENGEEFYAVNIIVGLSGDKPQIEGAVIFPWSKLNEYNNQMDQSETEEQMKEEKTTAKVQLAIACFEAERSSQNHYRVCKELLDAMNNDLTVVLGGKLADDDPESGIHFNIALFSTADGRNALPVFFIEDVAKEYAPVCMTVKIEKALRTYYDDPFYNDLFLKIDGAGIVLDRGDVKAMLEMHGERKNLLTRKDTPFTDKLEKEIKDYAISKSDEDRTKVIYRIVNCLAGDESWFIPGKGNGDIITVVKVAGDTGEECYALAFTSEKQSGSYADNIKHWGAETILREFAAQDGCDNIAINAFSDRFVLSREEVEKILDAFYRNDLTDVPGSEEYGFTFEAVDRAIELAGENKHDEAFEIVRDAVERLENTEFMKSGWRRRYHDFSHPFEEILYREVSGNANSMPVLPFCGANLYYIYGVLLKERGWYMEAERAFNNATNFNQAFANAYIEMTELYLMIERWDEFLMELGAAYDFSYTRENVSACYRLLGEYLMKEERFEEAMAAFNVSLEFSDNEKTEEAVERLKELAGDDIEPCDEEEFSEICEEFFFDEGGASAEVLEDAEKYLEYFENEGDDKDAAEFLRGVLDDLSPGRSYKLELKYPCSKDEYNDVCKIIERLRDTAYEHLVVELNEYPEKLMFIQTARVGDGYRVEVALDVGGERPRIVFLPEAALKECKNVFYTVCVEGKRPNTDGWEVLAGFDGIDKDEEKNK